MHHTQDRLFQTIFDQLAEPRMVIKPEGDDFIIVTTNKAYNQIANAGETDLQGISIWSVFQSGAMAGNSVEVFKAGLKDATAHQHPVKLPAFPYYIIDFDGSESVQWWQVEIAPVAGSSGNTEYLMCTTQNMTGQVQYEQALVQARQKEAGLLIEQINLNEELAAMNEELAANNEELTFSKKELALINHELEQRIQERTKELRVSEARLGSVVYSTPVAIAILKGEDHVVELANQPMLDIWGRCLEDMLGKKLMSVFPELAYQEFPKLLKQVLEEGTPITLREAAADINTPDGGMIRKYLNFGYDPLFDMDGNVEAVLASVLDVTDATLSKQALQEQNEELEALNEEINASNEEIIAGNEELMAINQELLSVQEELSFANDRLVFNEGVFRGIFEQSPLAIALLTGPELVIQEVNDNALGLWGYSRETVQGKPFKVARPEMEGQPFISYLENTFKSGKAFRYKEAKAYLMRNGELQPGYFTSVYQPMRNANGEVVGLLLIMEEVTEQVMARQKVDLLEQEFRQAVSTANLGVWNINIKSRNLYFSEPLRQLFGLPLEGCITVDDAMEAVDHETRASIYELIRNGIENQRPYDIEHPITNLQTQERFWVRVTGKAFFNTEGMAETFAGVFMDITEQKQDEQRKNDFIGMVSHELKSPLTSQRGYLQLLQMKAAKLEDTAMQSMLSRTLMQTDKMVSLINGFLDRAKLQSGKLYLLPELFDLDALIHETTADLGHTDMSRHALEITDCGSVQVKADRTKIGQVIQNFVSNAVKYSPDGGKIIINCHVIDGMVRVSVSDEGIGIKLSDQEHLFERFFRVSSQQMDQIEGTGLGLYLSAEIIKRHQGKIGAESKPGKGSTFWFMLPLS